MFAGAERDGTSDFGPAGITEIRVDHCRFVNTQQRAAIRGKVESIGPVRRYIQVAGEKEADLIIAGTGDLSGVALLIQRITDAHTRRMKALGLNP